MTTIRTRAWRHGEVVGDGFPLSELDTWLADEDALVWTDLCGTGDGVLGQLAEELGLSPMAVEDSVAVGERVKIARHPGHLFITCYATRIDDSRTVTHRSRLLTSQISVFIMRRGLVTVRNDPSFDIDSVMRRWEDDADLLGQGVFALLHGLLDDVVDSHFDAVQHLDDAVEAIEGGLFEDGVTRQEVQEGIYRLRREVVELRRVVLPMREVVLSIVRRRGAPDNGDPTHRSATPTMTGSALDGWYDDLYDHALRAAEWTDSLRDMIGGLFETNLSLQDARLNTIMKKLAGWAAIIAVPTAITGWFGQNIPYPGFGDTWGLVSSVALIVVGSVVLYAVFKKQDWI